jgi:hypothetical protein
LNVVIILLDFLGALKGIIGKYGKQLVCYSIAAPASVIELFARPLKRQLWEGANLAICTL